MKKLTGLSLFFIIILKLEIPFKINKMYFTAVSSVLIYFKRIFLIHIMSQKFRFYLCFNYYLVRSFESFFSAVSTFKWFSFHLEVNFLSFEDFSLLKFKNKYRLIQVVYLFVSSKLFFFYTSTV